MPTTELFSHSSADISCRFIEKLRLSHKHSHAHTYSITHTHTITQSSPGGWISTDISLQVDMDIPLLTALVFSQFHCSAGMEILGITGSTCIALGCHSPHWALICSLYLGADNPWVFTTSFDWRLSKRPPGFLALWASISVQGPRMSARL